MLSYHLRVFAVIAVLLLLLASFAEAINNPNGYFKISSGTFFGIALILLVIYFAVSTLIGVVVSRYILLIHFLSLILSCALMIGGPILVWYANDVAYMRRRETRGGRYATEGSKKTALGKFGRVERMVVCTGSAPP
jgi:hypothetical protein